MVCRGPPPTMRWPAASRIDRIRRRIRSTTSVDAAHAAHAVRSSFSPQQRIYQLSSPCPWQTSTSAPQHSMGLVYEPLPLVNSITRSLAVPPKSRKSDSPPMSLSLDDTPSQKQVRGPIRLSRLLNVSASPPHFMHTFCIRNIYERSEPL